MNERRGVMAWLGAHCRQPWFAPADARDLGVVRALLAGMILVLSFWYQRSFELWGTIQPWVWDPVLLYRAAPPGAPSAPLLLGVLWVWRAALLLLAAGLWTRASGIVAALTGLVVLGLPQNLGKVNHDYGLVMVCLIVLAVSRAGDAWSLDRLREIVRCALGPFQRDEAKRGPEYRWPLTLMQLMGTLVLFSAGLAKLRSPGAMAWVMSDNLQNTLVRHFYTHRPPLRIGLWLAGMPIVSRALAAGALLLELSAPLLLLLRGRLRAVVTALVIMMLLSFGLVLGVLFLHFVLALGILLFPWRLFGARLATRVPVRSFTVIYDGSCRLCRKTVAVIAAMDLMERVEVRDALRDWPSLSTRFPSLTQLQCLESMHVVRSDGRTYAGFAGYRALAWAIPGWWPILPVLYVPGVPQVGQLIYERIAARRLQEGCQVPRAAN
jgi:predicted DCC family thiol-disulfide oxidoreductase YuxK